MESKATELLSTLKNQNLSVDVKVARVTSVKSDIKQKNVPEGAVSCLFESLRLAIASQHSTLLAAGFSTLGHLLKRLFIQEQQHLVAHQARALYPLLLERLGDYKDRIRQQAAQAFTDLWPAASTEVEHHVLEVALVGKNPRAKETSLTWLANMTRNHGLLFRAYVPSLVACLEDADSGVRETAKNTVIELFQNAPARAKSDLKKQLAVHNVRRSIANAILSNIGLGMNDYEGTSSARPVSRADTLHPRPVSRAEGLHQRPVSVMSSRSHHPGEAKEGNRPTGLSHSNSIDSLAVSATSELLQEGQKIEPFMVSSGREIEEIVREIGPDFEGRESEANWILRERHVATLRRLTQGNAPFSFSNQYFAAIKALLDGIFKVVNSLRTTLSTAGCLLVQEIARTCGSKIDSMVEIILQNLIKLCAGMKKISAQNGNDTVDAVIENVSYTFRILQHVTAAFQDKNVGLRLYAAGWMRTLINRQAHYKASIEHGGGHELLEKAIKKGLTDANPGVREAIRSTFWTFFKVWPDRGDEILASLDNKSRSLLERDPSNPSVAQSSPKRLNASRAGLPKSTSTNTGRSALKEAIAARKKAQLPHTNTLPPRPESAQSTFPEAKGSEVSPKSTTSRTVPTGLPLSSLSSAPVRPAMKSRRPELARPATADPYAARKTPTTESRTKSRNLNIDSPKFSKSITSATSPSKASGLSRSRPKADLLHTNTSKAKPRKLDICGLANRDTNNLTTASRSQSNESLTNSSVEMNPRSESVHTAEPLHSSVPASPESLHKSAGKRHGNTLDEGFLSADDLLPPVGSLRPEVIPATGDDHFSTESVGNLGKRIHKHIQQVDAKFSAEMRNDTLKIYEDPAPINMEGNQGINNNTWNPAIPSDRLDQEAELQAGTEGEVPIEIKATPDTPPVFSTTETYVPVSHREIDEPIASKGDMLLTPVDPPAFASNTDIQLSIDISEHVASEHVSAVDHLKLSETLLPATTDPSISLNNENTTRYGGKGAGVSTINRSATKANALEELPTNESAYRHIMLLRSPETKSGPVPSSNDTSRRGWRKVDNPGRRRSLSPRSNDPAKAREMLSKGVQRIQTKNMDILGYRKLQGLLDHHDGIFPNVATYDEMLLALLDELESPPDDTRQPLGRPLDLKTQVLLTIRYVFGQNKMFASAHYPRAITAVINARKRYEASCHVVAGLDEIAEAIVAVCRPDEVVDAVLDLIETEEINVEGCRAIAMGISVLSKLCRRLNGSNSHLPQQTIQRVGKFAGENLMAAQPDIRRQATGLCVQLHGMLKGEEALFWKVVGSPGDSHRNLLAYYINKT